MPSTDAVARLQQLDRFVVRQRITPLAHRYEIRELTDAGRPGDVLALASQKRLALREQVTFFADEQRSDSVFSWRCRNVLDLAAVTDVLDGAGNVIGTFRKDVAASLFRSTYRLEQPGHPAAIGTERSPAVALLRRFVLEGLPYHFDFRSADGSPAMSVVKRWAWGRDVYSVEVPDQGLDRRLAAAMAVAVDVLQRR